MQSDRDNQSLRWMLTLCQCAAIILIIAAATLADDRSEIQANRPLAPAGPRAGEIVAPHEPVAVPTSPALPQGGKAATSPQEMDERMRDLARRMAEAESSGEQKDAGRSSAALSPLSESQHDATDKQATTSNQLRVADPADARPLGARRQTPEAEPVPAGSSTTSSAMTVLMALGLVIGLIFLLRAGMRKMLGTSAAVSSSSAVQVLTRVAVAPRNHVLLLRVGGRILVVSDCPSGMRTLSQIDAPDEVADILTTISSAKSTSATAGFRQMLSSMGASYEPEPSAAEAGTDEGEFQIDRARDNVSGLLGKLRNLTGRGGTR